jgi:hypothetical protein
MNNNLHTITKESIAALLEAKNGYRFQMALQKALNKDRLDAMDYEPILVEMTKENTLQGQSCP